MNKRSLILALSLVSTTALVGCSNKESSFENVLSSTKNINIDKIKIPSYTEFKLGETLVNTGYSTDLTNIEGYTRLKSLGNDYSGTEYKDFILPGYPEGPNNHEKIYGFDSNSNTDGRYYVIDNNAQKIKSLLGNDVKLVPIKEDDFGNIYPEQYLVKGYEDFDYTLDDERYIQVNLQEDEIEEKGETYPVEPVKINFHAESPSYEKALKMMLSMEKEIKTMLDNLLIKEDSDEVLRMIQDEISRNNANPKESSYITIKINENMYIHYGFSNYLDEEYTVSLSFSSEDNTELDGYKYTHAKPNSLKDLVLGNYKDEEPNSFYLNPNLNLNTFDYDFEELLAKIYKDEIATGQIDWDGVSEIESDVVIYEDSDKSVVIDSSLLESLVSGRVGIGIDFQKSDIDFAIKETRKALDKIFIATPEVVDIIVEKITEHINSGSQENLSFNVEEDLYEGISINVYTFDGEDYRIVIA